MKISSKLVVVGTEPQMDFLGKNNTMMVKFSGAENHNINKGTRENPLWETISTSWYNFEAWGDTAKKIMEAKIKEGDAFSFEGYHQVDKVQKKNEKPRYYPKYKITKIDFYERRKDDSEEA